MSVKHCSLVGCRQDKLWAVSPASEPTNVICDLDGAMRAGVG